MRSDWSDCRCRARIGAGSDFRPCLSASRGPHGKSYRALARLGPLRCPTRVQMEGNHFPADHTGAAMRRQPRAVGSRLPRTPEAAEETHPVSTIGVPPHDGRRSATAHDGFPDSTLTAACVDVCFCPIAAYERAAPRTRGHTQLALGRARLDRAPREPSLDAPRTSAGRH